ncbi:unnamed protein product (macronuclear) [Paramecium tetraurelia]|uniref:Uncharacterized protein n=1 Tax=Paramecium tetraurelia TaxID=5888 RepID=A0E9T3_PARTE|nr:uncharacterized protein GSPATT00024781001 [Paramecium tetraurelia]CAK92050.1 unnamed protein product [Paramecium tetraurelia]|eukprot:XP_001459447.1 hypothetical protein (macronuclear) [Paramecium tetraurelia strain d4-2]
MGICQSSINKLNKNQKNKHNEGKYTSNTNKIDKSKTVRIFDYNQNKIVEVPVLVPATQNSLYSKRQSQSPITNPNSRQLIPQSS